MPVTSTVLIDFYKMCFRITYFGRPASFLLQWLGVLWAAHTSIILYDYCSRNHIVQTLTSGIKKHQKISNTQGEEIEKIAKKPARGCAKANGLTFFAHHANAHGTLSYGSAPFTALHQREIKPGRNDRDKYGWNDYYHQVNEAGNHPFHKGCVNDGLGLRLGLVKYCHVFQID